MTHHESHTDNSNLVTGYTLGSAAGKVKAGAAVMGVGALLVAMVWGIAIGDRMGRFLHSYLWSFMLFLGIAIGSLFFVLIQHVVKAQWSTVVRRLAEILTATFPLLLVLSLVFLVPLLLGNTSLYLWSNPDVMAHDHLLHAKEGYLNAPFFVARVLLCLAAFAAISRYFFKQSTTQDETGDFAHTRRMRRASGPALVAFAILTSVLAFDLLMSLEPHWFSTIFGVYYFGGSTLSMYASLILFAFILQRAGYLANSVNVEHFHDLGKLLFAFVFFWGYIGFSQFMLIWYANMPEETGWFALRMNMGTENGIGYGWVSLFLILFHFAFPFVCLLSRWTKRLSLPIGKKGLPILVLFAAYLIGMRWVDLYWLTMPSYGLPSETFPVAVFHPIDVLNLVGLAGLFIAAVAHNAGKVNLLAIKDPSLKASLRFENT